MHHFIDDIDVPHPYNELASFLCVIKISLNSWEHLSQGKKLSVPATEYKIWGTKNNKSKVNLESVYQIISNSNAGYLLL